MRYQSSVQFHDSLILHASQVYNHTLDSTTQLQLTLYGHHLTSATPGLALPVTTNMCTGDVTRVLVDVDTVKLSPALVDVGPDEHDSLMVLSGLKCSN